MSTQMYKKEKGFATSILSSEVGLACVECGNLFSKTDVLYIMHKDGIIIQCNSMMCFVKQGGMIDEYQINTIICRKSTPKLTTTPESISHTSFEVQVIKQYKRIREIEDILIEEFGKAFNNNPAKLGMYMKMIDENMQEGV